MKPRFEFDSHEVKPELKGEHPVHYQRGLEEPDLPLQVELSSVGECELFGGRAEGLDSATGVEDEVQSLLSRVQRQLDSSRREGAKVSGSQPRWKRLLQQKAHEMALLMPLITGSEITRNRK